MKSNRGLEAFLERHTRRPTDGARTFSRRAQTLDLAGGRAFAAFVVDELDITSEHFSDQDHKVMHTDFAAGAEIEGAADDLSAIRRRERESTVLLMLGGHLLQKGRAIPTVVKSIAKLELRR